jgi:hypothetical protein
MKRNKKCETYARGRITAHEPDGTCHCGGMSGVLSTTIPMRVTKHKRKATQNRLKIRGTSMKKFDLSTSFFVAPQVMLNENKCARRAVEMCMLSPPKKKKLILVNEGIDVNRCILTRTVST